MPKTMSYLQFLRVQGFDLSRMVPFGGGWRVRCSGCEAAVINRRPCHETGCPNIPHWSDEEGVS